MNDIMINRSARLLGSHEERSGVESKIPWASVHYTPKRSMPRVTYANTISFPPVASERSLFVLPLHARCTTTNKFYAKPPRESNSRE